jgi:hypothetical protein
MKNKRGLLVFAILAVCVLMLIWWVYKELQIDSCLDLGGRWNYEESVCETAPKNS